jgi:hypothetical protein
VHIDWASLSAVAVVAAAAALTVVLLVASALVAMSARAERRDGPGGRAGSHPAAATPVAVLCICAAGLVVCYGLYTIVV